MKEGISLIISCYNSEKLIKPTLEHIANLDISGGFPVELLIIDNASTDLTSSLAKEIWDKLGNPFPARIIYEAKQGLIHVRNTGFKKAEYEYIVFVDHDNWLDKDYVQNVFRLFKENSNAGAIGGYNIPVFESEKPFWFDTFQNWYAVGKLADYAGVPDEIGVFGAGLSIRKSIHETLSNNGFKSMLAGRDGKSLNSGEDYELCKAIKIAGWDILYFPELQLQHFLETKRLKWEYFRELNKGESRSLIYFLAYEYWIAKDVMPKKPLLGLRFSWSFLVLKNIIKIVLLKTKMAFNPELKKEGSSLLISLEREQILFGDLMKKRIEYISLKKSIGKAKWRNFVHSL